MKKKITKKDLSFRVTFQGALVIGQGFFDERQYFGYSKRDAIKMYLAWANGN